ncbi:MAG: nucleotide sugar dehydrogenase [Christensenellaceae bacterium]
MKVNVIGLGYIGLPTALMLATSGVEVVGTDYNSQLVDTLKANKLTFEEKDLDKLFTKAIEAGIQFTTEYIATDIYIVAVPTPYIKETKKIDPLYVINAFKSVLKVAPKGAIVIIESTVSPGTMDKFVRPVLADMKAEVGKDIHLVHAPERILPGNMVYELVHNSRTIGADSQDVALKVKALYESFCQAEIVLTDIRSAEMSKVVENTFRDINIAFANELAKICRHDNMDVYEIIRIANHHPRVNILQPGPGVGGHCISVDPWFLVGDYPELTKIIRAAREVNDGMPSYVISRIKTIMKEHGITDISRVGLYGLSYKENVDDVRESPSLQLLEILENHLSFGIKSYDPFVKSRIVDNQYFSLESFLKDIDLVVVMVAHSQIRTQEALLVNKIVLDTRHVLVSTATYTL